jgi:hypothetical protein
VRGSGKNVNFLLPLLTPDPPLVWSRPRIIIIAKKKKKEEEEEEKWNVSVECFILSAQNTRANTWATTIHNAAKRQWHIFLK